LYHADAYCYKTFQCNQKYRCGLLLAIRRSFSLSVHASLARKSFLQPCCHDSYHDGSYYPPVRAISGTTALCTDCPDQNAPAPAFEDYVATRPLEVHSGQYLLSSGAALTCRYPLKMRMDNVPELVSLALAQWAEEHSVALIKSGNGAQGSVILLWS
jgi:hypothetical protein